MNNNVVIYEKIEDYPHLTLVKDKNASGFPNEINQHQFDNFIKFKKDIMKEKLLPNFNRYDDYYLLKFLRARKFDLEKTMIMFKNFLDWRKREDIDNIERNFHFTEQLEVKKLYPHGYHKIDKLCRPIYIELISQINLKELFKITDDKRLILYYVQEYERVMRYRFKACSKLKGEVVDQSFTILDLKGIGLGDMMGKTRKFLQLATSIGQDYYPENLGVMFLVNTSSFFSAVWSIVKGFIDEKTRKKIQVEKDKYQKKLLEFVDAENLPSFLGGTCTCSHIPGGCLYSDIGPWNPEGGLKPVINQS